ncbi:adenylate/guanylate cyclase domain-containing protein [Micromonospora sp. PLK6-60]|uniref:adenylate/guanylate cyclase domain-containing protein n=1 Tax=Micromonospora sp. PLK6-60 TaxID=2873383 RepID=UPI0027DFEF1A|nr:adenylate/guanylate cyclase domain-containing protein [Micromonospora sp. PLK6-60]
MSILATGRKPGTTTCWPAPEERRTVSVLFADIVGSTGLVERLDPEDVRALQRDYFDTVAGVLRRWGGTVEKYVGDAVMALFGAGNSDGFDAYRAVRAGLEIQRALDRRPLTGATAVRIRVGVATGEVLVDVPAARDGAHGVASGAVITTAARLQEYAPPGAVALCAATHRATVGLVEQRPLASMAVAGKALPLDVWRAVRPVSPHADRHPGPLVGRRRELATASDEVVEAVRHRRPRWVALAGPTGSGRSRLLHELIRAVSTVDGAPVRWCVTRCPPYPGEAAPLADLVRRFAGIGEHDPGPVVHRRLAAALDGLLPLDTAVPALVDLLAGAARGADVWRQALLALAARQPVVVAVDDLDRAAPSLGRFLRILLAEASLRKLPLVVVTTHGPGRADPVPGGERVRRVPLPALGAVDTGRLLRHLLDRAGRPAALARVLLPLVGGNPGIAAAYVRALDEAGTASAPTVPDQVRRIADARLDRLDGEQRAVLAAAAALGAGITAGAVERLLGWAAGRAGRALRHLVAGGLLRRCRGVGYLLTEPVLARVAHGRLPRAARAELARRADRRSPAPVSLPPRSRPDLVEGDRVGLLDGGPSGGPAGAVPDRPGLRDEPVAAAPDRSGAGAPAAPGSRRVPWPVIDRWPPGPEEHHGPLRAGADRPAVASASGRANRDARAAPPVAA